MQLAKLYKHFLQYDVILSTLLRLIYVVCERGDIYLIGVTNHLQDIDPAFHRLGCFVNEIHFRIPYLKVHFDIINIRIIIIPGCSLGLECLCLEWFSL